MSRHPTHAEPVAGVVLRPHDHRLNPQARLEGSRAVVTVYALSFEQSWAALLVHGRKMVEARC